VINHGRNNFCELRSELNENEQNCDENFHRTDPVADTDRRIRPSIAESLRFQVPEFINTICPGPFYFGTIQDVRQFSDLVSVASPSRYSSESHFRGRGYCDCEKSISLARVHTTGNCRVGGNGLESNDTRISWDCIPVLGR
jgi:hypothetical protein